MSYPLCLEAPPICNHWSIFLFSIRVSLTSQGENRPRQMKRIRQQTKTGEYTLLWEEMNETYHSREGAISESQHVFVKQAKLYLENTKKDNLRIFEMGFGTGLNAYSTLKSHPCACLLRSHWGASLVTSRGNKPGLSRRQWPNFMGENPPMCMGERGRDKRWFYFEKTLWFLRKNAVKTQLFWPDLFRCLCTPKTTSSLVSRMHGYHVLLACTRRQIVDVFCRWICEKKLKRSGLWPRASTWSKRKEGNDGSSKRKKAVAYSLNPFSTQHSMRVIKLSANWAPLYGIGTAPLSCRMAFKKTRIACSRFCGGVGPPWTGLLFQQLHGSSHLHSSHWWWRICPHCNAYPGYRKAKCCFFVVSSPPVSLGGVGFSLQEKTKANEKARPSISKFFSIRSVEN